MDLLAKKMDLSLCSKVGIDTTTKTSAEGYHRGFVKEVKFSEEILKEVEKKWKGYGFK